MRLLKVSSFVISTVIVIYLVYFYYTSRDQTTTIVEIYPDKTATKIKPNDLDGIVVKNTDNGLYENLKSKTINNRKVTLLTEPEEPILIKSSELEEDPLHVIFSNFENEVSDIEENKTLNTKLNVVHIEDALHNRGAEKKSNVKSDRYKVQLASVKTQDEASLEWNKIQRNHSKILGNIQVTFKKVNHENSKFFYLIIAGDYENLSQAKAVCKKLSTRQQSCIVTK